MYSSEAVALWRLLDHLAAKGESKKMPHGAGAIVFDARLCLYLDRELNEDLDQGEARIGRELLFELFVAGTPRPVRQAYALITSWIAGRDRAEQVEMLVRWGRKHGRSLPEPPKRRDLAPPEKSWRPAETDTRERIVGAYFGGAP